MLPTAVEEADTLPLVGDESDRQLSEAVGKVIINVSAINALQSILTRYSRALYGRRTRSNRRGWA